jgi:hypothetical protein
MVAENLSNLVELEFRRDENKYFVPPSFTSQAIQNVEKICLAQGCEKEVHEHPITRSAYYYLGDTDSMPPGFSVRYREYVDHPISEGGVQQGNSAGFYEIKWLDEYESGRPIKRKLRLQGKYSKNITLDEVRAMATQIDQESKLGKEVLPSLDKHLEAISQEGFESLTPLFIAEYKRSRYLHNTDDGKKNIVSVDQDVHFYQVREEGQPKDLGGIDGCIVEYKESSDDTKLRWQLYRTLVNSNATRFYGKKGEALNLLQRARSKNAPLIRNELKGYEIEGKLDILTDLQQSSRLVSQLYRHFDQEDHDFIITPGFSSTNSQSTMGTYVIDPRHPGIEGKMLVGLEAKYSTKMVSAEDSNGVLVRHEEKGDRFEYNRQKAREIMKGMEIAGKTQRIRRAFYLSSRETGRVYKLSIDYNWKLPIQEKDFFSQLEVEYTGIPTQQFEGISEPGTPTFEAIKKETSKLTDDIKQHLDRLGIPYGKGQRKVDMLST